jgi:hypothetical protein
LVVARIIARDAVKNIFLGAAAEKYIAHCASSSHVAYGTTALPVRVKEHATLIFTLMDHLLSAFAIPIFFARAKQQVTDINQSSRCGWLSG